MQISNKTYDILKWVAQLLLPALATFVMSLGNIWGIPYSEQISLTLVALDTALGVVLGISTKSYNSNKLSEKEDSL
jgi:hypothetical protein